MRSFLLATVTALAAGSASFGAVLQTRDLGAGSSIAHMDVQFTDGQAVQFNYAYTADASNPLTGLQLLTDVQTATTGTATPFTFTDTYYAQYNAYSINTLAYNGSINGQNGYVAPDGYWHYWTKDTAANAWTYSSIGASDRVLTNGAYDGWSFSDTQPVPEPAAMAIFGLATLGALRRRKRVVGASLVGLTTAAAGTSATAADSVTVVGGSYAQGTVKASLATAAYSNTSTNLSDFPLNTGGSAANTFPIALSNGDFSGSTLLAFGNGGGVTFKFDSPVNALAGAKEIGVFTAQFLASNGSLFNGNMQASVLVSSDGTNWRTLDGATVADPTTYTTTSYELNAPSTGYVYNSGSQSWTLGLGTSATNLAALTPANYLAPMVDDSIFNDPTLGTNSARAALIADTTGSVYASVYGTSGGGNWFDISNSGLASVQYLRLNGVNTDTTGGIRLDSVFANAAAVPEPAGLVALLVVGLSLKRRR